jgi:serine/threonine protein phosphatase PrpC
LFANLGDSRAIYGNKVERITDDYNHYPQIMNTMLMLGVIVHFRNMISISRSFGDLNYSKFIKTTPSIYERDYEEGDHFGL